MKVKCENLVRCGNSNCINNQDGYSCYHIVVAIDSDGRCALCQPKVKPASNDGDKPMQNKTYITHGALDY